MVNLKVRQQIIFTSEGKKVDCLDDSGRPSRVALIKHLYFRRTKGGMSVRSGTAARSCFLVQSNYYVCQSFMCVGLLTLQWADELLRLSDGCLG